MNGKVSSLLKDAGIVNDAMSFWYTLNKGRSTLVSGIGEFSGNIHGPGTILGNGVFHPETFIGSASITISPINDREVMVKVFNVTSLMSGDMFKHLPWNNYPKSVVRTPGLPAYDIKNQYGNISQTYMFTLPIDNTKLK